jgi:hypothetical protein
MELDVENAGTWFSWHDSRVCLRVCPGSKIREFKKAAGVKLLGEVVFDPKSRAAQKIMTEKIGDEDLFSRLLWDYVIVGWEGFTTKGVEFPCTIDNKLLAINNDAKFSSFVTKVLRDLGEVEEAEEAAASKNS